MKLQFRLLKSFENEINLLEVCYLEWQRDPEKNPQEAEIEDNSSVRWKFMGTVLISDEKLEELGNVVNVALVQD